MSRDLRTLWSFFNANNYLIIKLLYKIVLDTFSLFIHGQKFSFPCKQSVFLFISNWDKSIWCLVNILAFIFHFLFSFFSYLSSHSLFEFFYFLKIILNCAFCIFIHGQAKESVLFVDFFLCVFTSFFLLYHSSLS